MFNFCMAEFFNKEDDAGLAIVDSSLQSGQHSIVNNQGNKTKITRMVEPHLLLGINDHAMIQFEM